ncbi:MAG: CinA family nicotinamide mononucleotide deamidase-related protein [Sphingobacteriales bacterium]|nr:MAG: CinA family nicotinamide mononucleotide deamidase-related protein [Sphingobacteriales bacterium]
MPVIAKFVSFKCMEIRTAILISIGDELLIGQTIDTNSAWIAKQLNRLGIQIALKLTISDTQEAIKNALDLAIPQSDLIICTGGLGPTKDDITKLTLNDYFGGTIVRNPTVHDHVVRFFEKRNRPMLLVNDMQADVPDNCTVLFNRMGTAPGMLFEQPGTWVISLPGVPKEMQVILEEELLPRIKANTIRDQHIIYKYLLLFGRGESFVAQDIEDIENVLPGHIHLSYLPNYGELKLRLSGSGTDYAVLNHEMDTYIGLIRNRLEDYVVADEDLNLEEALVKQLKEHRLTMSTAESCTGGLISSKLTDVSGASAVYIGSVIAYHNRIKQTELNVSQNLLNTVGAVSEATVLEMARSVRERMDTDISVAVSGILGPTGATAEKPVGLVYFAIASVKGTQAFSFNFPYDRAINKEMAAKTALNLVRKEMMRLVSAG